MKPLLKKFVIKKYVFAKSAIDAIRIEKKIPVDDVWVDEDWRKMSHSTTNTPIGFVGE